MSVLSRVWRTVSLVFCVSLVTLLMILPTPRFGGSSSHPGTLATVIVDQPAGGVPVSESLTALPETQRNNGMVVVPAGDFVMGGDPLNGTERGRVVFVAEFMIDRTEVTNAAFAEFVLQTGYRTVAEQRADARSWRAHAQQALATHPVVYIAWEDAIAYCEHVGKRLPSESEWEKAARGSEAWMWPWGNDWDEMRANSMERGKVGTTPVGAFPMGASPYGLVDMAGNVWEWTMSSYTESLSDDPSDREVADELFRDHRVLRGGSWRTMALGTQAMYRKPAPVDYRRDTTGFRCAKNVP